MVYNLDSPVPEFEDQDVTVTNAEILEEISDDTTDKIKLFPEMAKSIEQLLRGAITQTLGAAIDSMSINGVDPNLRGIIMASSIELLKSRGIFDLTKF